MTPEIKLKEKGSTIDLILEIHIKNPFDTEIDAAVIVLLTHAELTFEVNKDLKIEAEITDIQMKALDF